MEKTEDRSRPPRHKRSLPKEDLDTEFKRQYPPEPLGEELKDYARVWRVYQDEATKADATMLDGWNKTLDILLVFAGLFSAVVTAFFGQSNMQLQPDSNVYIANALFHLVAANGGTNPLPSPPVLDVVPTSTVVWVNGLWLTSLLLSLVVAFLCILAKQWTGEYIVRTTSSSKDAHHWSRRRAFYFSGLKAWGLHSFLSWLPVLLHMSLFLFIAGLCLLMWNVNRPIAYCVIALGGCLAVFYTTTMFVPVLRQDWPTALPLVKPLRATFFAMLLTALELCIAGFPAVRKAFLGVRRVVLWPIYDACVFAIRKLSLERVRIPSHSSNPPPFHMPFFDKELSLLIGSRPVPQGLLSLQGVLRSLRRTSSGDPWELAEGIIDADALRWLILDCSDHDVVAVGYQALGAVAHDSQLANHIDIDHAVCNTLTFESACTYTTTSTWRNTTELMRILRSVLFIDPPVITNDLFALSYFWMGALLSEYYPDMVLVSECAKVYRNSGGLRAVAQEVVSPSSDLAHSATIQSTLALIFRIPSLPIPPFCELLFGASEDTLISNCAFIAAKLCRGHPDSPPCVLPHRYLRYDGTCPAPLPCLAEAICAGMETTLKEGLDWRLYLGKHAAPFVVRLLSFDGMDSPTLFDMPHLLFCLTSDEFISCLDDASTIARISNLVGPLQNWRFTDANIRNTAIAGLAKLCRHFASEAPWNKNTDPVLHNLIRRVMHCAVFLTGNYRPHSAFKGFLGRTNPFSIPEPDVLEYSAFHPPWDDLLALLPKSCAPNDRIDLAFTMSAALCSSYANAAGRVSELGFERLSESLVNLLKERQLTDEVGATLRGIVRHLLQLRPTGWPTYVWELKESGVAASAGEITRDALFLGPCVECSGYGGYRRWERETEDHLVVVCARLGVPLDNPDDALQFHEEFRILGETWGAVADTSDWTWASREPA